jgi:hypothetical protein
MLSVCLCIPHIKFWMPEPVIMKLGTYIMASEPISTAHFLNPSYQSVYLYVYPHVVARQRLGKDYRGNENTRSNRRIVDRVVLYAVHVVSKTKTKLRGL